MFRIKVELIVVIILTINQIVQSGPYQRKLLNDLFKEYRIAERPVDDENKTVDVRVSLEITQIDEYDREHEILKTRGWLQIIWKDSNLRWVPKNYGNIQSIRIPSSDIWLPDFMIYNSVNTELKLSSDTNLIVDYKGNVLYLPPLKFETFCAYKYEKDRLNCKIKMGSWTNHQATLNLQNGEFSFNYLVEHDKTWTISNGTSVLESNKYECCIEEYQFLIFNIELKKLD